jgi:hypothetical protein
MVPVRFVVLLSMAQVAFVAQAVKPLAREHLISNVGQKEWGVRKLGVSKAALLGDVALTVVSGRASQENGENEGTQGAVRNSGENIFGPFENGFGPQQDSVITGQLGCSTGTSKCYSEGGSDVTIAEKICAYNCNITLPRTEGGKYYGFLDTCGGHTKDYHYHKNLNCLYQHTAGSTHSAKIAKIKTGASGGGSGSGSSSGSGSGTGGPTCSDKSTPKCPDGSALKKSNLPCTGGKPKCDDGSDATPPKKRRRRLAAGEDVYGKWEDFSEQVLPELDACNGHWGKTPDSPDKDVYHYHVSDLPPFTIGCYGPNDDNSHVTVQQCRDAYSECSETADLELFTVMDANGSVHEFPYQPWCPCWDKSKDGPDGVGLNVGKVLPSRKWKVRTFESSNQQWSTNRDGTFSQLSSYSTGVDIKDISEDFSHPAPEIAATSAGKLNNSPSYSVFHAKVILTLFCGLTIAMEMIM